MTKRRVVLLKRTALAAVIAAASGLAACDDVAQVDGPSGLDEAQQGAEDLDCEPGYIATEGSCEALPPVIDVATITSAVVTPVKPGLGGSLRVHYPVDITVTVEGSNAAEPTELPVMVTLGQGDGSPACVLGVLDVPVTAGTRQWAGTRRVSVPPECLPPTTKPGGFVTYQVATTLDPYEVIWGPHHEAPQRLTVWDEPAVVTASDGLDVDLMEVQLESSVVLLRTCSPSGPTDAYRCRRIGGSYVRDGVEVTVSSRVGVYGIASHDTHGQPVDALGGEPLHISYAVRPEGSPTWQPLWVASRNPAVMRQASTTLGGMRANADSQTLDGLYFHDPACDGPSCETTAFDLMVDGAWRDQTVFEVQACAMTDAEGTDRLDDNCITQKVLVLREWQVANEQADDVGARGEEACPTGGGPGLNGCFGWHYVYPTDAPNTTWGSADYFSLNFDAGTHLRVDFLRAVSKHDVSLALGGKYAPPTFPGEPSHGPPKLASELFRGWIWAAAYADPDDYLSDSDAPPTCTCKVKNLHNHIKTTFKCRDRCLNKDVLPAECAGGAASVLAAAATGGGATADCRKRCMESCRGECATPGTDKKQKTSCAKKRQKNWEGCTCKAYYDYGIRVFGIQVENLFPKQTGKKYGRAKAGGLQFELIAPLFKKRLKKGFKKRVGPFSVSLRIQAGGEFGVKLKVVLDGESGGREPYPEPNLCMTGTETDSCGGPSLGGNCYCDAACTYYGDCCDDFAWTCINEMPWLEVIDVEDGKFKVGNGTAESASLENGIPICGGPKCREALRNTNFVLGLTLEAGPYVIVDALGSFSGDLAVVRGSLTLGGIIAAIELPVVFEGRLGLKGTLDAIRKIALNLSVSVWARLTLLELTITVVFEAFNPLKAIGSLFGGNPDPWHQFVNEHFTWTAYKQDHELFRAETSPGLQWDFVESYQAPPEED